LTFGKILIAATAMLPVVAGFTPASAAVYIRPHLDRGRDRNPWRASGASRGRWKSITNGFVCCGSSGSGSWPAPSRKQVFIHQIW